MPTLLIIILLLILIAIGPWFVIWALNTLFLLSIPFTLKTWAATLVLTVMIASNRK